MNIWFIICQQHQASSGKIKTNKAQQISVKTQVFFRKNLNYNIFTTPSKSFYIFFVDIFLTRDQARKHDSHLWRYKNEVTGVQ